MFESAEGASGKPELTVPNPEQPQQEKPHVPIMLVYGQGPIKPVLIKEELTEEQQVQWDEFSKDPLHHEEPEFRVIEGTAYTSELDKVEARTDISDEEKSQLEKSIRQKWQEKGRFALNKYGRTVALAAGVALSEGLSDKLILCGGKTIPNWLGGKLTPQQLKIWPTEAKLMKDLIIRRFAEQYQKKFPGLNIEDAIILEDGSPTTVHNIASAFQKYGDVLRNAQEVGFLAADFHLQRVTLLAQLLFENEEAMARSIPVSAQVKLEERAQNKGYNRYAEMLRYLREGIDKTGQPNIELKTRQGKEARLKRELTDPRVLASWGLSGRVTNELQVVIWRLNNPDWVNEVRPLFSQLGLNFDNFTAEEISRLQQSNPTGFNQLKDGIIALNTKFTPPWQTGGVSIKENK